MVGREKLKISVKWQKIFPVYCRMNQQELKQTQPMMNPVRSDTYLKKTNKQISFE